MLEAASRCGRLRLSADVPSPGVQVCCGEVSSGVGTARSARVWTARGQTPAWLQGAKAVTWPGRASLAAVAEASPNRPDVLLPSGILPRFAFRSL